ncbi:polysaccharide chain length determinant protein, PEP-CTERM locus subfamily [Desulfacinum hydrothermale DSM 13146]|uniref:Polysaccharide chain length determinant protein, PEP-CTERM locus subfamily n=1 Tax=Desulfacinum hydrothermale DSM 13146 TaxID=1121390 RepID=A0A1W1XS85_9BACT|nr:Wzz/FepE/Etk N-terminal domain-containing protein [Desulfacinum hydrothermale]SMC26411.1 polysaccharide chain length determinant protein, PEP-CTERM locus subfamily [Desulfacinum hydrothermale DSM 13146]
MQLPKLDLEPYVDMAWRRKWWILIPTLLGLAVGLVVLQVSPKIYRASTLILVEPQRIPTGYVRPTVTQDVASRLRTISEQVNSRTNLERIIEEFKLYRKPEDRVQDLISKIRRKINTWRHGEEAAVKKEEEAVATADLVGKLRSRISINVDRSGSSFRISFRWHDPTTAAAVTNAIASQFIEQNLKVREEMAMGTTAFLKNEVEKLRRDLAEREKEVEDFKQKHMGMLPDQLESNLNILNQLQQELTTLQQRIDEQKKQELLLQDRIQDLKAGRLSPSSAVVAGERQKTPEAQQLEALEEKLKQARVRYTEKHPDVIALKRTIERLRQEVARVGVYVQGDDLEGQGRLSPRQILELQLEKLRQEMEANEVQLSALKEQIAQYRERVEKTPAVGLQLGNILRDYNTVRSRYSSMVAKLLDAQMAEELEKRQKGEQFRILDPAVAPSQPVEPDAKKVMTLAVVLGLGLGGGLAYALELLDPRFYRPEEVESYLNTRVLVSLPGLKDEDDKRRWWSLRFRKKAA